MLELRNCNVKQHAAPAARRQPHNQRQTGLTKRRDVDDCWHAEQMLEENNQDRLSIHTFLLPIAASPTLYIPSRNSTDISARLCMIMKCLSFRALAAQTLLSFTHLATADLSHVIVTLTSTTTIRTSTTTVTQSGRTHTTWTTVTPKTTSGRTPAASAAPMAGGGHSSYAGSVFESAVLNSTNFFRKQYLAEPVTWDAELARYAQRHAHECIWEHSVRPTLRHETGYSY